MLHTILGASGATGQAVTAELQKMNFPIRVVERTKDVPGFTTVKADLLDARQAMDAVAGSSHVYLCVGLPYRADVWQRDWPRLMQNVIEACAASQARLIFLDNVYMYGPAPLRTPFDENHPQKPPTAKGVARKTTADLLLAAFDSGKVRGVIGRSADFYGPLAVYSPFYISILQRMLEGKAPQSISKPAIPHTYAYSGDNGRALVALALDESTYGQVWHLPVGKPVTVEEITALLNAELGTAFKTAFLPGFMVGLLSLFIPPLKEAAAMLYQFNAPYIMSFEKFRQKFPDFQVTSYEEGVREMVASFRGRAGMKMNI